jgi:hypothetical protein
VVESRGDWIAVVRQGRGSQLRRRADTCAVMVIGTGPESTRVQSESAAWTKLG